MSHAAYTGRNLRSFLKNQILKRRLYVPPKRRYVYAALYGVKFHETALFYWRGYFFELELLTVVCHTNMTAFKYRAFLLSPPPALLLYVIYPVFLFLTELTRTSLTISRW